MNKKTRCSHYNVGWVRVLLRYVKLMVEFMLKANSFESNPLFVFSYLFFSLFKAYGHEQNTKKCVQIKIYCQKNEEEMKQAFWTGFIRPNANSFAHIWKKKKRSFPSFGLYQRFGIDEYLRSERLSARTSKILRLKAIWTIEFKAWMKNKKNEPKMQPERLNFHSLNATNK